MSLPLDEDALIRWPLARLDSSADKEARGRLVIVGGSLRVPGAPLLAGVAGLRGGAGKVQLAIPRSLAATLGATFPEAGILPLAETDDGEIDVSDRGSIVSALERADAVLIGPGIMDEACGRALATELLRRVRGPTFVIDAFALTGLEIDSTLTRAHEGRIVITPHAGEMASLLDVAKTAVTHEPLHFATDASRRLVCTTVLKGSDTTIVQPDGTSYVHRLDNPGLATAGSGDVLAGLIAGLIARGNTTLVASLWGVYVHAAAGAELAQRVAPVGFLARELLDEIPRRFRMSTRRTRD